MLLIKPAYYTRIHPRIRRMTGLETKDFDEAPLFSEAIHHFESWCGTDYVLTTWGCDDVSVLYQNMTFFGCQSQLQSFYDIQMLFGDVYHLGKNRKSLALAMESLGIEQDIDKAFHDALNDATYTALVYQKLPKPEDIHKFPITPRPLIHTKHRTVSMRNSKHYNSISEALLSDEALRPACPVCGKTTLLEGQYVFLAGNKYASLSRCKTHRLIYVRLTIVHDRDEAVWMSVISSLSDSHKNAYIHTKRLQTQVQTDPLRALLDSSYTCLPFED
jgi:inhibitor of KinA sporulation pathway (predicted exonuclease)